MDKYYKNSNKRISLQGNPPPSFPPPIPQNRRSPGFQGDPSFVQGFPQHQNHFPNARIKRVETFATSQVEF